MPLFKRSDADLVRTETPVRAILPYVMRGRNESAIYHQETYDITQARSWLRQFNRSRSNKPPASLFHLFLFACAQGLHRRPEINRFVSGGRLYKRRGVFISVAAKKAFKDDAPLTTIKLPFPEIESFESAVDRINDAIMEGRGPRRSTVDKELALAVAMPGWLLGGLMRVLRWLDRINLKPQFMIESDPLYTSLFVANLGSVGLDRVFHHLYEEGTGSVFGALGVPRKTTSLDRQGRVQSRDELEVRWTLDERVADAFYCAASLKIARRIIEDPARHFGAEHSADALAEAVRASG